MDGVPAPPQPAGASGAKGDDAPKAWHNRPVTGALPCPPLLRAGKKRRSRQLRQRLPLHPHIERPPSQKEPVGVQAQC